MPHPRSKAFAQLTWARRKGASDAQAIHFRRAGLGRRDRSHLSDAVFCGEGMALNVRKAGGMDHAVDERASMKSSMERCFRRWAAVSARLGSPELPPWPWDPDIEPFIWVGDPTASGWCAWRPVPKTRDAVLAGAAPALPPMHPSLDAYFNSFWFCTLEGPAKGRDHAVTLDGVMPGIELDAFLRNARSYARAHGGRLDHVSIGLEAVSDRLLVVDNGSGAVMTEDWNRDGTPFFEPVAPSLVALVDVLHAVVEP